MKTINAAYIDAYGDTVYTTIHMRSASRHGTVSNEAVSDAFFIALMVLPYIAACVIEAL